MMSLVLRWAGCLDEGYRACHTRGTSPGGQLPRAAFYAKSDYFDEPLPARGRASDDRLDRAPPAHAVARLGRADPGRLRRRVQQAGRRRDGVRASRHAVLAPVRRLLQRQRRAQPRLDQRRLEGAAALRLRPGLPELHRPSADHLAPGLLRLQPPAAARDQEAGRPGLRVPLPPGDPAGPPDGSRLAPPAAGPARLPAVRGGGHARARVGRDVLRRRGAARARSHRQRRPRGRSPSPRSRCRA